MLPKLLRAETRDQFVRSNKPSFHQLGFLLQSLSVRDGRLVLFTLHFQLVLELLNVDGDLVEISQSLMVDALQSRHLLRRQHNRQGAKHQQMYE